MGQDRKQPEPPCGPAIRSTPRDGRAVAERHRRPGKDQARFRDAATRLCYGPGDDPTEDAAAAGSLGAAAKAGSDPVPRGANPALQCRPSCGGGKIRIVTAIPGKPGPGNTLTRQRPDARPSPQSPARGSAGFFRRAILAVTTSPQAKAPRCQTGAKSRLRTLAARCSGTQPHPKFGAAISQGQPPRSCHPAKGACTGASYGHIVTPPSDARVSADLAKDH
jgi:hypothetical protein